MQIASNTLCRPDAIFPQLNANPTKRYIQPCYNYESLIIHRRPKQIWVLVKTYDYDKFLEPRAIHSWEFSPKSLRDFRHPKIINEGISLLCLKELLENGFVDTGNAKYCINKITMSEYKL